jgi:hypothetical protein
LFACRAATKRTGRARSRRQATVNAASAAGRSTSPRSGTASIWDDAADRQGEAYRGIIDLAGDAAVDIPAARLHWWILPVGAGTDVSSRTAGGGSIAVLYQNELHDWRTSGQANPFFARLGILFGKPR